VSIAVVYKYNLIEQGGMTPGAHLNYLQFQSAAAASVVVAYNTSYQTPQVSTPSGEGFQFSAYGAGGSVKNVVFAYNTMIATGGIPGRAMSSMNHGGGSQNAGIRHDNYVDPTAAYGALYPGSFAGWTFSNNYLMTTGAAF
jgi:hypothetical protein